MDTMRTAVSPPTTAALLAPPRGYRPLAWLGLIANLLAVPLAVAGVLADPPWRAVNIPVAAGGVLPAAVVGLIAAVALLQWRSWGQILAIVALSLSLAVTVPYGVVRLVLVEEGRLLLAVLGPLFWAVNISLLVFWCRPAIGDYLR
ncbi:MAG: Hepatitis C virus core protein [Synechococcaceae cyanobacterium]|nr:Hepatitis C virus core protein [Synechococcaceae cyanobacterium]